jgi:hypothetical protein
MFRALSCLVAVLTLAWGHAATAQPAATAGSAVIQGRVTDQSTGRPLGNVRVHAASTALPDGRTTYTGPRGEYALTALPAGHYTVTAIKATYLTAAYGQPRPLELGSTIDVSAQPSVGGIDFRLVRAGIIAGRVTDEFGRPSGSALVAATRYRFIRGARTRALAAASPPGSARSWCSPAMKANGGMCCDMSSGRRPIHQVDSKSARCRQASTTSRLGTAFRGSAGPTISI